MSVAILSIAFNHHRGQATAQTIPLRYDAQQIVSLPEWRYGQIFPSVAAYVMDRLQATASVAVQVAVSHEPGDIEVRAVSMPLYSGLAPASPLLASLSPQRIPGGRPAGIYPVEFGFDTAALALGVDVGTVQWQWQFRRSSDDPWLDFQQTVHKVFSILSTPTEPWQVAGFAAIHAPLPRTDMLDLACLWAHGAMNVTEAASKITEAVNQLGGATLSYDASVGAPHYTSLGIPQFLCDEFMDRLRGGIGLGPLVNCSDCATIVSTFANLVGADLWQSKMGLVGLGFDLNPLRVIGSNEWSTLSGSFGFHEVAWTGDCSEDDLVYDACVQIDWDDNPSVAPHVAALPTALRFGSEGEGQYRDRLSPPDSRHRCVPQPQLRIRRPLQGFAVASLEWPQAIRASLAGRLDIPSESPSSASLLFEEFTWFGGELPQWTLIYCRCCKTPHEPVSVVRAAASGNSHRRMREVIAIWRSPRKPGAQLRIDVIETGGHQMAYQRLIELMGEIQHPGLKLWQRGSGAETSVTLDEGTLAAFTRGNLVVVVRVAGLLKEDVRRHAELIDQWLLEAGTDDSNPEDFPAAPTTAQPMTAQPTTVQWRRTQLDNHPQSALLSTRALRQGKTTVVAARHAHRWGIAAGTAP